jgi:hypothetical protein
MSAYDPKRTPIPVLPVAWFLRCSGSSVFF